jgi:hypothetical protein
MRHRHEPPCNEKPTTECESLACEAIVKERNRFFTGKYMTARDFNLERDYFLSRHRLHNRLLHGWGIICGLKVKPHPNSECQNRWIMVRSGIALDCCGRELILEKEAYLDLEAAEKKAAEKEETEKEKVEKEKGKEDATQQQRQHDDTTQQAATSSDAKKFLVCLRYKEKGVEEVPVLVDEGKCDSRLVPNHVREITCVELEAVDDEKLSRCWPQENKTYKGDSNVPCRDDCDEYEDDTNCLKPSCPCGECVPLALVWRDEQDQIQIEMKGRKQIFTPMTHINRISWEHGGVVTLKQLRDEKGLLKVYFDRKLDKTSSAGTGINEHTFVVQYGGTQESLEFVDSDKDYPRLEENGCVAVFKIDPDLLEERGRKSKTLENYNIYITLRCDFILDCHGNPVDGNHLAGRLPSGDGVAGGVFESWFRVVSEDELSETGGKAHADNNPFAKSQ